jgi:ABC-type hemin transport system ATPase subunit
MNQSRDLVLHAMFAAHLAGAAEWGVVHDVRLAARSSDRLPVLHDRRIPADGTPDEVLHKDYLRTAFQVSLIVLTTSATGARHVVFEST